MQLTQKELAIQLRKHGKSYNEILDVVPVAKSTLSLWLRSVSLSKPQVQQMTALRREASLRGARARRNARLQEIEDLATDGKREIGVISERELWLIGIALYWAEGSKQNVRSPSTGILFSNSDPTMISLFLRWLSSQDVSESRIVIELYVHKSRVSDIDEFKEWWSRAVGIRKERFDRVYLKSGNPSTKRSNVDDLYHGLLRIKVKSSTSLNRKISGWVSAIAQ